ncbi:tr [Leptolyngbya sp. Heron Island J]|uniref:hypothetical protein n=1 Tax=Leptolyngbya sp. Heron Island J TaxID=1385935 RepID=UPI0003B9B94E|nr:hypothetical protein [Leptolyngbya sp. Heron Island J]ESA36045.1 tr [Leptolyngbya sp. Heron Island J]
MAGFFGLFGGKKNQGPQSKEAFFLSEDEAKTFGDIDFMRKEVVIRRTFAKKKGQEEEMESVKSISSGTSKTVGEAVKPAAAPSFGVSSFSTPAPAAQPASPAYEKPAPQADPAPAAQPASPASEKPAPQADPAPAAQPVVRRDTDTGMDMFRDMAKKMRR